MKHSTNKGSDLSTIVPDQLSATLQLHFGSEKDHNMLITFNVFGEILNCEIPMLNLSDEALKMTFGKNYKKVKQRLEQNRNGLSYVFPLLAFNSDVKLEQIPNWLLPGFEKLKALQNAARASVSELATIYQIQNDWVRETVQMVPLSTYFVDYQKIFTHIINLWSADKADFFDAVHWLGKNKIELAFGPMVARMDANDTFVFRNVCTALGKMGGDEVRQLMTELTQSNDKTTVQIACMVLGEMKDNRTVVPILKLLKDNDEDVRQVAISALGKIKDSAALDVLTHIGQTDSSKYIRKFATETIRVINS